jgi:hypothetical protein
LQEIKNYKEVTVLSSSAYLKKQSISVNSSRYEIINSSPNVFQRCAANLSPIPDQIQCNVISYYPFNVHHNGNLITEQGTGEQNPLFQLAIDTLLTSATT